MLCSVPCSDIDLSGFSKQLLESKRPPFRLPSILDLSPSLNECSTLVSACQNGLADGIKPKLIEEGLGGTYLLESAAGAKLGVFKPFDEDPSSLKNPKQQQKPGDDDSSINNSPALRKGIDAGTAVFRECAAWWIDQNNNGFVGIPPTTLVALREETSSSSSSSLSSPLTKHLPVEPGCSPILPPRNIASPGSKQKGIDYSDLKGRSPCTHRSASRDLASPYSFPLNNSGSSNNTPETINVRSSSLGRVRIGSLQKWMDHDYQSWDVGFSLFPIDQVHRIGIFDIRVLNTDRHGGNLLVKETRNWGETKFNLIPIDHSFILPSTLHEAYFEWLHWPQAKVPFDPAIKEFVASLDWRSDVQLLKNKLQDIQQRLLFSREATQLQAFTDKHFRILRIMTTFLKKTVAAGCSLFEIASMICRDESRSYYNSTDTNNELPPPCSLLEEFCLKALKKVLSNNQNSQTEIVSKPLEEWEPETTNQEEKFFQELEFLIEEYLLCFFPPPSPR